MFSIKAKPYPDTVPSRVALAGKGLAMTAARQQYTLDPIAVSVPEATQMLGFKDMRVVDRLIRNGDIKARKIGRVWRVNVKSLYEYMGA